MNDASTKSTNPPFELTIGDLVEARDQLGARWQGMVEMTALEHGIFWIHTFMGERKLLDAQEHTIRILGTSKLSGLFHSGKEDR